MVKIAQNDVERMGSKWAQPIILPSEDHEDAFDDNDAAALGNKKAVCRRVALLKNAARMVAIKGRSTQLSDDQNKRKCELINSNGDATHFHIKRSTSPRKLALPTDVAKVLVTTREISYQPFQDDEEKKDDEEISHSDITNAMKSPMKRRKSVDNDLIFYHSTMSTLENTATHTRNTSDLGFMSFPEMSFTSELFFKNKDQIQLPDKKLTGVDESITEVCANISHQIYSVRSATDFKLKEETTDADKVIIFDNHSVFNITSPSFVVAVTGDTLIMGWRGTQEIFDLVTDISLNPVTASELGKAASGIRGHGLMFSHVSSDLMIHQDEIIKYIKEEKNGITNIVFTGHSLGGGLANVAHLFVQAQIDEGKRGSVWNGLERLTLRTVAFASVMSILDGCEVDGKNEVADTLMEKVGKNSCNIIYGPDAVPRGYAHSDYLYDTLKKAAPELMKTQGNIAIRLARVPLTERLVDLVANTFITLLPVMVKYRHLGKLLYYGNNTIMEPVELTDTGPLVKNDPDRHNKNLLKHYKFEDYEIRNGEYVKTLRDAHSYFPKAFASYISP